MSRLVKVPGFIHAEKCWDGEYTYVHFMSEDMSSCGYMLVGPCDLEYPLPPEWNATAAEIAALRKAKDTLQDEFTRKSAELTDKINNLLCLDAPAVAPRPASDFGHSNISDTDFDAIPF